MEALISMLKIWRHEVIMLMIVYSLTLLVKINLITIIYVNKYDCLSKLGYSPLRYHL